MWVLDYLRAGRLPDLTVPNRVATPGDKAPTFFEAYGQWMQSPMPTWEDVAWLRELWAQRRDALSLYDLKHWSERAVIALVMQTVDNSIVTKPLKTPFGWFLTSSQGHGEPNPTWIPAGNEVTRRIAKKIDGVAGGTWGELFNIPLTAHFLGGCPIGPTPEEGVIDPYHRLHGYPGIHVVDGSAVSANLGVNPALTITAQAERAMASWPNKGDPDPRPAPGRPYERIAPVPPRNPLKPAHGAGRLAPAGPPCPTWSGLIASRLADTPAGCPFAPHAWRP